MSAATLTAEQAARWSRRMPRSLLRVLVVSTLLVALVVDEPRLPPAGCQVPDGCGSLLDAVIAASALGLVLVALPLALAIPQQAVWVGAVGAALGGWSGLPSGLDPAVFRTTAVLLTAVGVADVVARRRQRARAAGWPSVPGPAPTADQAAGRVLWAEDPRRPAGRALLAHLVGVGALLVLVDGEGPDPGWLVLLPSAAAALGAALVWRAWRSGAARMRLVRTAGSAVHVRVGRDGGLLLITTTDDPRFARPLGAVREVGPLLEPADRGGDHPEDHLLLFAPADEGGSLVTVVGLRGDGDPVRLLLDRHDLVSGPVLDPGPWRHARSAWQRLRGSRGPQHPPLPTSPTTVSPAAAALPAAPPLRALPAAPPLRSGPGAAPSRPGGREPLSQAGRAPLASTVLPVLAPIGLPLAYLLALAAYPVTMSSLDGDGSVGELFRVAVHCVVGTRALGFLAMLRQPVLGRHPLGVVHTTTWSRQVVPRHQVQGVLTTASRVSLRLARPAEPLHVVPEDLAPRSHRWHEGAPSTAQVEAAVTAWLHAAQPAMTQDLLPRRLTVAVPPTILLVGAVLGAWLVTRFAG